jgi:hypothetical protein
LRCLSPVESSPVKSKGKSSFGNRVNLSPKVIDNAHPNSEPDADFQSKPNRSHGCFILLPSYVTIRHRTVKVERAHSDAVNVGDIARGVVVENCLLCHSLFHRQLVFIALCVSEIARVTFNRELDMAVYGHIQCFVVAMTQRASYHVDHLSSVYLVIRDVIPRGHLLTISDGDDPSSSFRAAIEQNAVLPNSILAL